ncbi:hypothetical protein [Methylobacterium fujisawaense]|jgi:hypothetical protein
MAGRETVETDMGTASRARLLWHVTANEASAAASPRDGRRLDTRQDTPPGAFRV